jgi:hypothetical protein
VCVGINPNDPALVTLVENVRTSCLIDTVAAQGSDTPPPPGSADIVQPFMGMFVCVFFSLNKWLDFGIVFLIDFGHQCSSVKTRTKDIRHSIFFYHSKLF